MANPEKYIVENIYDRENTFVRFDLVPRESEPYKNGVRSESINLVHYHTYKDYDKQSGKLMIKSLKAWYRLGVRNINLQVMTKMKCEDFFNDDSNFNLSNNEEITSKGKRTNSLF